MQGFLSWKFFSDVRFIDSCVPDFFLGRDAMILVFGGFLSEKIFFRFFLAYFR